MLEILKFIFSSFWIWLGMMLLLSAISGTAFSFTRAIATGVRGR